MTETTQFLINHGLPIIFGAVLLEQLGLPLPAMPWLLAAGALAAEGKFSLSQGITVAVIACLPADGFWFYLGRFRGSKVLGLLCRISLEPDSCVRRTQNVFTRYGMRGVVIAKFLPGMSTVAPPLAGMAGISFGRFLLYDGLGSLLYGLCFILLGYFFSAQIQQIGAALASVGGSAFLLLAGLAALYIGYKYWQRHRLLRELRMARITVDELRRKLDDGENPFILDLRSAEELQQDPSVIQGAIHTHLDEIEKRHHEFPRDRDNVVYCCWRLTRRSVGTIVANGAVAHRGKTTEEKRLRAIEVLSSRKFCSKKTSMKGHRPAGHFPGINTTQPTKLPRLPAGSFYKVRLMLGKSTASLPVGLAF